MAYINLSSRCNAAKIFTVGCVIGGRRGFAASEANFAPIATVPGEDAFLRSKVVCPAVPLIQRFLSFHFHYRSDIMAWVRCAD